MLVESMGRLQLKGMSREQMTASKILPQTDFWRLFERYLFFHLVLTTNAILLFRDHAAVWSHKSSLSLTSGDLQKLRPHPDAGDTHARVQQFAARFCANMNCLETFCNAHGVFLEHYYLLS